MWFSFDSRRMPVVSLKIAHSLPLLCSNRDATSLRAAGERQLFAEAPVDGS